MKRVQPHLVLLLVDLALAAGLAAYWLQAPSWPEPAALPPDAAALAPQVPVRVLPDATVVQAITERPLFSPGRSAAGGNGRAESFQDFRLVGLLGSGEASVALLGSGSAIRRIRAGEQIDGWTLRGGDGRTAHFSRGEHAGPGRDLFMAHARQQPIAPPTPAGTAAAAPAPPAATKAGEASPAPEDNSAAARRARREARQRVNAN